MNSRIGRLIVLSCFLCFPRAVILDAAQAAGEGDASRGPAAQPSRELMDLVRKTQDLAQQSQAELARSREQNEALRLLVEQTREELAKVREELSRLRSSMADARSNGTQTADGKTRIPGPAVSETGLAARLTRVEDQVDLNTAQIKEQSQTKVESDSRFKVRLFGLLLSNTYFNTAGSSEQPVPTEAPAPGAGSGRNLGATLRQTEFGFSMTGPKVGEARLSAAVDFDFFGISGAQYRNSVLGVLRMRTASARLDGARSSIAVGLMAPLVSPLNPDSLAAVYYPALAESGNLWQWRPQIVAERRAPISERSDLTLQGGLMMPFGDRIQDTVLEGRPGYESRLAFGRQLDADRRLQLGVGGYFHPQQFGFGRAVDSYATTSDWLIPLTGRLELSGEAYYGQSITLDKQSGENLADTFALSGPLSEASTRVRGIHSAGGWTQLRAGATSQLDFNFAFGIDDPRNRDVFAGVFTETSILKNQTFSVNAIYRLRSNLLLALEYRRMWTTYTEARAASGQVNLGVGYLF
jgi:hypothetical protein